MQRDLLLNGLNSVPIRKTDLFNFDPKLKRRDSSQLNTCTVFFDADSRFFTKWGGGSTLPLQNQIANTIIKMVNVFASIRAIYQKNYGNALQIQMVGAAVHQLETFNLPGN